MPLSQYPRDTVCVKRNIFVTSFSVVSLSNMWKIISVIISIRVRSSDEWFKDIFVIFVIFHKFTMISIRFSAEYFRTPHSVLLVVLWAYKILNDTFSGKRRLFLSAHNHVKKVCRINTCWTNYSDVAPHHDGGKI